MACTPSLASRWPATLRVPPPSSTCGFDTGVGLPRVATAAVPGTRAHIHQEGPRVLGCLPAGAALGMKMHVEQRGGGATLQRIALAVACVLVVSWIMPAAAKEGPLAPSGGQELREALDSLW